MSRIRYLLPFLLFAGAACVQAQPIVKINPGSSECDVTPTTGEIFRLDTNGNVLITGTLGGTGCGGGVQGGGSGTTTFNPLSPVPSPLTIISSPFQAGSGSAIVSYSAAFASSCTVAQTGAGSPVPSGSGSCPNVTLSNTGCTGTGTGNALNCSASGTVSEPTALSGPTSCNYTLTATCTGGVTSSANLSVTSGVVQPPPGSCPNLAKIGTGTANQYWSVVGTTSVKFGDNVTKSNVNGGDYVDVWSYPGSTVPWPGTRGLTTRPSASVNFYFAEKFVVPTDGSVTDHPNWALSGSGINANMSLAISACPGDFGQTGTQITTGCKVNQNNSSSGISVVVASSQQGFTCTVIPGNTYYLNILPMANLPSNDVSISSCSGTCTPWLGRN